MIPAKTVSRSVLITGCSSGFGRQMVSDFLKAGWRVHAGVRDLERRSELFDADRKAHPGQLNLIELDVTDAGQRARAVGILNEACPQGLDALINNAGYGLFGSLEDLSEAQLRYQMEVNFFGLALLTRDLLPSLRQARGRIVNLSSVFGFSGFPLTSAYCASKFAVEGLSESLRIELAPFGVQVMLVEPGGHRTRFGDQLIWGEGSLKSTSPYLARSQGYQRLRTQLSSRPHPATAESVSKAVVDQVSSPRSSKMPARLLCGKDARGMSFLKQTGLRSRLAERILHKIYHKMSLGGPV